MYEQQTKKYSSPVICALVLILAAAIVAAIVHFVDFKAVARPSGTPLNYPLTALQLAKQQKLPNIVWLVAESWRADTLNPEVMPNTYAFAQKNQQFLQHYSGGNNTRVGMFSMFYGLYGNYWDDFLQQQRSPVLLDVLEQNGYNMGFFSSASFKKPEFDKTIFAKVPQAKLHVDNKDYGWQRDARNVGELLGFIKKADKHQPFMAFMFFQSPQARYYFPEHSAIAKPYLDEFSYLAVDLNKDLTKIKNRYINSVHYMDGQFARILAALENEGLMEDTIVIVTGDHGEAFMEHGRWGHGSDFSAEQLMVPLIMHIPGQRAQQVARMTNHIDIIPTLLPQLGVLNPPQDYSLGSPLLNIGS